MRNKMAKSNLWTAGIRGARNAATLACICVIALAAATAVPVTLGDQGIAVKAAYAGNGNSGGNGNSDNGNGKDTAPGQEKKLADEMPADEDTITSVTDGRGDLDAQGTLPIADGAEPATKKVIKELAGLPEDSELSEEEELEAIRNGWGTWRTADGPETVIAQ